MSRPNTMSLTTPFTTTTTTTLTTTATYTTQPLSNIEKAQSYPSLRRQIWQEQERYYDTKNMQFNKIIICAILGGIAGGELLITRLCERGPFWMTLLQILFMLVNFAVVADESGFLTDAGKAIESELEEAWLATATEEQERQRMHFKALRD